MENENDTKSKGLSKNFWIIIGVLLLIIIIVVAVILSNNSYEVDLTGPSSRDTSELEEGDSGYDLGELDAEETTYTEPQTSVVSGTSSIVDDQVVDREGQPVRTDVAPMTPNAPQQSNPLNPDELPEEVIKLSVTAGGWSPAEFSVSPGQNITISVTSADQWTHIFKFDDASLNAIAVGVAPGETRAITFPTPSEVGEYTFRCDVPGHARRGEVGMMIVQ
jgi:plastocyanin